MEKIEIGRFLREIQGARRNSKRVGIEEENGTKDRIGSSHRKSQSINRIEMSMDDS